ISMRNRRRRQRRQPKRQKRPNRTTGSCHSATPATNGARETTTLCAVLLSSHVGLPILLRTHVGDVFSDQVFECFTVLMSQHRWGNFGCLFWRCRSAFRPRRRSVVVASWANPLATALPSKDFQEEPVVITETDSTTTGSGAP
ncbi:hypothetical protein, partial [Mycobacterium sp. SMC-19]|uniref:hypothetical protein n=1 Tax=Mycobacterium sp. SMC-19 TaxID=3381630 RepID=UPI0038767411